MFEYLVDKIILPGSLWFFNLKKNY